ncbi:hypothetical protein GmHk_18G052635 [Glycine max]|nr:hypothetical protein GmHk_18G052635 [Glycine max]
MVDSTRSKSHLDRLEEAIAKLTMNHLSLTATPNSMTLKLVELLQKMVTLESHPSSLTSSMDPPSLHPPQLKLEVPLFEDTDTLGWIFNITQFFDYHSTS